MFPSFPRLADPECVDDAEAVPRRATLSSFMSYSSNSEKFKYFPVSSVEIVNLLKDMLCMLSANKITAKNVRK